MPPATRLYALGSNGSGQLGQGHYGDLSEPSLCIFQSDDERDRDIRRTTLLHDEIVKLVAGGNHTLLLTKSGTIYATGDNEGGRYDPSGAFEMNNVFRSVKLASQLGVVSDIATTWDTSLLVVDSTKVYQFGLVSGQSLGKDECSSQVSTELKPVFDLAQYVLTDEGCEIVAISAGMQHVLVLLSNGVLYGWGSCRKGQLGKITGDLGAILTEPVEIQLSFEVAQAVAGRGYSFICDMNGDCVVLGEKKHFTQPHHFKQSHHDYLQSGWSTVFTLEDGSLRGVGRGNRGQLPPDDLPSLRTFAAGSEHALAQTQDDAVLAWGWGEHGNCGQPLDKRGNVSGRFNTITPKLDDRERLTGLGAGCATSFIWTLIELQMSPD